MLVYEDVLDLSPYDELATWLANSLDAPHAELPQESPPTLCPHIQPISVVEPPCPPRPPSPTFKPKRHLRRWQKRGTFLKHWEQTRKRVGTTLPTFIRIYAVRRGIHCLLHGLLCWPHTDWRLSTR